MAIAYYSVVQFVPIPDRDERTNVGVMVATEAGSDILLRLSERHDVERPDVIDRFGELLEHLLSTEFAEATSGRLTLDDLAHRRFSQFKISEPRSMDAESDDPARIAQQLAERLATAPSDASVHH